MAMIGSLALNTDNDQEDSDFFDQLENEFSGGDLGSFQTGNNQQVEKDRLDDGFSKLMPQDEDSAPSHAHSTIVPRLTSEKTDEINAADYDSWLDEEKVEISPSVEDAGSRVGEVPLEHIHPPVNPLVVANMTQNSANLRAEPEQTIATESLTKESSSSAVSENTISAENHVENLTRQELCLEDVCPAESSISESNATFLASDLLQESSETNSNSCRVTENLETAATENVGGFLGSECPDPAQCGTSSATSGISTSGHAIPVMNLDAGDASGSSGITELQWSSFGNSYMGDTSGSYSDFFSELGGQAITYVNEEATASSNGCLDKSLFDSLAASDVQGKTNTAEESLDWQTTSNLNTSAANQSDGMDFWNQEGAYNYGVTEQENFSFNTVPTSLEEPQFTSGSNQPATGSVTAISENSNVGYSSFTPNHDQSQGVQQSWEDMYPGWYFDYASNEWKQIEGWGTTQQQEASIIEGDPSSLSVSQAARATTESAWQNSEGQGMIPASGSDQVFNNEQQYVNTPSVVQQTNWEDQYPGWYYDYQLQQWCQVPDGGQNWASNQELTCASPQTLEPLQNTQLSGEGWVDQHYQAYQSEVKQSVHLPEESHTFYGSSKGAGDRNTFSRGISFNAWSEPGLHEQGKHEAQQINNANSWAGFSNQAVHTHQSPSQGEFSIADKSSFFGQVQDSFQSYNTPIKEVAAAYSPDGRPSHALAVFGFGGKLVTMKASQSGICEHLVLHDLNHLIARGEQCGYSDALYFSALDRQGLSGPLCGSTSKDVLKWVDEQIENCGKEDNQRTNSKGLWVLWGVLKIACLHYGKLRSVGGSARVTSQMEDGPEVALGRLLATAKSHFQWNQGLVPSMDVLPSLPAGAQLQEAVEEVRNFLMDGRKKEALQFAQQGQLWGLALVLASQLGEQAYADTILQMAQQQFQPGSPMRTLLLLFSGQASELFKVQSFSLSNGAYGSLSSTPYNAQDSAGGMLRDWLGNLSIIAANPTKGDEQVLKHLGDSLWKDQDEVAGAHTCYLVADTSFELFSKEARLCLIGADHFKYQRTFATPQAIQRTELYEYAKTLGNPQYVLVPFQPFKLLYAHMLAEAGRISEASRYCQLVLKNLRSAGRGADVEFCKFSAAALEERLRLHSQGGYSFNFSTGKLVGKVMGTIDSTIHKIIGGPPVSQQSSPAFASPVSLQSSPSTWGSQDLYGNENSVVSSSKTAPIIPSASNINLSSVSSQVDVPTRSVSEPNLMRQEANVAATTAETSVSPTQLKPAGANGSYLGRFGSQLVKAIGFIRHKKEAKLGDENKFYYDEKLKRWVEAGAEQSAEEASIAPPPMDSSFNSKAVGSASDSRFVAESQIQGTALSSSADLPPIPPSNNQFSARGRLHGVRSRYVDTFNKGSNQTPSKPPPSASMPASTAVGQWGVASSPTQFFAAAPSSTVAYESFDSRSNDVSNFGGPELQTSMSGYGKAYMQAENEPLLPKNLNSSFMDVPVLQKHSSAGNFAMLTDNDPIPGRSDTTVSNIQRAVSWSGGSPDSFGQLTNGSIADVHGKTPSASVLPSPPVLEPAPFYAGHINEGIASGSMLSGSLQGASTFGDMQEVEL
ncbi:hypothetical protein KP509_06G071900 [Ceratopteris richardii]|uniref:Protein transport protein sec16 n=1 Tax=Ceratopteris richardii TaxID=49495 RepID=A0A8T2UP09_CERRI|nr:hypothetical protein KP509_06G071900 [Ceratopteris richardii]